MNTMLRRIMGTCTGNRIYQVSRFQLPSIISPGCVSPFRLLSNDSVDNTLIKMLKQKIAEDPSKRWLVDRMYGTHTQLEIGARTVLITGHLTEEIESGSELPALMVVDKVFSILGCSPQIEAMNQYADPSNMQSDIKRREGAGKRFIYVTLPNVDDAQNMLMNSRLPLLKDCGTLDLTLKIQYRVKDVVGEMKLIQKLKQKIAEDPTKRWYIHTCYVTNIEFEENDKASTVVIKGQLSEEIESGSELPGLEVINKVFSILGHNSPKIEDWTQGSIKRGNKAGTRLIYVRLSRVHDALKIMNGNDRVFLEGCGSLSLNINRSLLLEELKQKMIENPSLYYYIDNGKIQSLKPDSIMANEMELQQILKGGEKRRKKRRRNGRNKQA